MHQRGMKRAAVYALAGLAKEAVPESVEQAYRRIGIGATLVQTTDSALISTVAPAVAKAAIESGVARTQLSTGISTNSN